LFIGTSFACGLNPPSALISLKNPYLRTDTDMIILPKSFIVKGYSQSSGQRQSNIYCCGSPYQEFEIPNS